MRKVMRKGVFVVEGNIGDLNKKIFKQLEEEVLISNITQADAIEETGGVPHGAKVKNRKIYLNKKNNLLARIMFEVNF